jgi:hypothetical protein
MRQRPRRLRPATIGHQPTGHRHRDRHQGQESRYYQRNDEADHGDANVFDSLSAGSFRRVHEPFLAPLEGQNRVRLDGYFFSQLAGDEVAGDGHVCVVFSVDVAFSSAEGVVASAVHRLTFSEAHSDVALEPDVVAAREFESVEAGQQALSVGVVFPFAEDGGICGAAVLVCHQVLVFDVVFHSFGHTTSGEASVDGSRLYVYLQHEVVTDFGRVNLLACRSHDLHQTSGWRASVCDGSCCGQHRHVEAQCYVLFAGLVDALDVISLGFVRHQFGMLLDYQYEAGLSVDVDQAAISEVYFEDFGNGAGVRR